MRIVKDKFGIRLNLGDEIIYSYNQSLQKGRIVRFTHRGSVVVDNYPSYKYNEETRRYEHKQVVKSLGWKECAKVTVCNVYELESLSLKREE